MVLFEREVLLKNFVLLLCAVTMCSIGCSRTYVEPGSVGIKVNAYGNSKGVEDYPVLTGVIWYNSFTETVYEYPVHVQNITWTKDATEGSPTDESLSFNSKEGAILNADIGFSLALDPEKVPTLFKKYRKDIDIIIRGYLRNKIRDAINNEASQHNATEIFGQGRSVILANAKKQLREELEPEGFIVDELTFANEIRADDRVKASINSVIEASQRALEAEQKVKQIEAEARQKIAESQGQAESILLKAKADAEANKMLSESVTPALLQYEAMRKWDGVLPKFTGGGAVPFVNLDSNSK